MAQNNPNTTITHQEANTSRGLLFVVGLFQVIFALWLITAPGVAVSVLVQVLGIYWLVIGVLHLVEIFSRDNTHSKFWLGLSGVLGILAGLLVLNHPLQATIITGFTVTFLVAMAGIAIGVISLIRGFQDGGISSFLLGAVSIILGIFLWQNPLGTTLALPIFLGIITLASGIVFLFLSLTSRQ